MSKTKEIIETILYEKDKDVSQENANLNGKTTSAKQNLIAGAVLKEYAMDMLDDDVRDAFKDGFIHIHDFDHYALGTTTCTQIQLDEVLKDGFTTNGSNVREAQSITVAMAHAAIIMQANQNQQHGGQAFPNWDFDLAPYVEKSYQTHKMKFIEDGHNLDKAQKLAFEETEKETMQACEAFVHNMNTMNGSRGGQSVFSSINFGLDTSWQGRMITKSTLYAMIMGIGDGFTAIYPICIFKLQHGINMKSGEPNYDLFKLAQFATTKRLFPNYQFVDATFNINKETDDPRHSIATMGCRTRVFENLHGIDTPVGRGNASFSTINLPMVAKQSIEDGKPFFELLDYYTDLVIKQLEQRLMYQSEQLVSTFDFVYTQGSFNMTEKKELEDKLGKLLLQDTLGVGFIGLAECLHLLYDGENVVSNTMVRTVGKSIIEHMRDRVDVAKIVTNLNYSLLATPSEGLAGKSHRNYVAKFGDIKGLEDNDFFTNSFHVPVWVDCTAKEKIEIEAPYHEMTLGGHISYIELSGEDAKDLDKVEELILYMGECNMGYASINTPIDRCLTCDNTDPIPGDRCPKCGDANISRVRRITGYLVGDMSKWNTGKKDEESKRVKHKL